VLTFLTDPGINHDRIISRNSLYVQQHPQQPSQNSYILCAHHIELNSYAFFSFLRFR